MKKTAILIFDVAIGGTAAVVQSIIKKIDTSNLLVITCDELLSDFQGLNGCNAQSIGRFNDKSFFVKCKNKLFKFLKVNNDWIERREAKIRAKKVEKIIKKENVEVVHAHLMQSIFCLSEINLDIKKIATIHDSHGLDNGGFNIISSETVKQIYEKMDVVTSAVNYFFYLFEKNNIILKEKVIIDNGFDSEEFENVNKIDFQNDNINIVFLGGDLLVKGCDYLEKAINILVNESSIRNLKVHVLRNVSTDSEFYKNIVADKLLDYFNFVGYVSNGKHLEYIKAADVFVLPSRTEGAANTLLEAIGLGKCIVATNVGGTPELIENNVTGLLSAQSAEELADCLEKVISDESLRMSITRANKERCNEFSWDRIAKKYIQLYE